MCYLYTPLRTCIIAARYSPEFHAYKLYVGGGTCSIVNGRGGVGGYFESLGCSKRHCAARSVYGERLEHTLGARFLSIRAQHQLKTLVRSKQSGPRTEGQSRQWQYHCFIETNGILMLPCLRICDDGRPKLKTMWCSSSKPDFALAL